MWGTKFRKPNEGADRGITTEGGGFSTRFQKRGRSNRAAVGSGGGMQPCRWPKNGGGEGLFLGRPSGGVGGTRLTGQMVKDILVRKRKGRKPSDPSKKKQGPQGRSFLEKKTGLRPVKVRGDCHGVSLRGGQNHRRTESPPKKGPGTEKNSPPWGKKGVERKWGEKLTL